MMKKLMVGIAVAAALCVVPAAAFAAELPLSASGIDMAAQDGQDFTISSIDEFQDLLKQAKNGATAESPYNITFGAGTYNVSAQIRIPDNVNIDLGGQTVNSKVDYALAIRGANVSVTNGTLQGTGIRVDVDDSAGSITNLTVNDASSYGVYVCASGTIGSITDNTVARAAVVGINIQSGKVAGDIADNTITDCKSEDKGSIYLVSGAKVSGKIARNTITGGKGHGIHLFSKSSCGNIEDNTITGIGNRGILLTGASTSKTNDGCSAGDVTGNKLTDVFSHGISIYHGSHVGKISYNELKNIGGSNNYTIADFGIIVNAGCPFKTYAKEITHNTVDTVTYAAIVVFTGPEGDTTGKWQDNGYLEGDIAYNTVKNNATINKKIDWSKSTSYKKNPCEGAIYVDSHALVKGSIHHNTINTSYDDGINILAYSKVTSIHDNTVTNASFAGIAVANRSTVTKGIYNNTVKGSKNHGIFVNTSSTVKSKISKNKITNAGVNGIFAASKSQVAAVSNNTITNAGMYGIMSTGGSKIASATSNTISINNKKDGIGIISNTDSAIPTIKGNKITGKYCCGIRVKLPSAATKVLSNTMTCSSPKSARSVGISVDTNKNTVTITGNKITGNNTAAGIQIKKGGKSSISKNTIKKSARDVLYWS